MSTASSRKVKGILYFTFIVDRRLSQGYFRSIVKVVYRYKSVRKLKINSLNDMLFRFSNAKTSYNYPPNIKNGVQYGFNIAKV